MLSVKVSTKHQIVVPSAARRELGIQAGDRLEVVVVDEAIVLRRRPARASERLRGMASGAGVYGTDPDTYLRGLRDEWEERAIGRSARVGRLDAPAASTDRA